MPATAGSDVAAVEAQDLWLRHGTHVAIEAATFSCRRGEVVAVVGPNGSGKSTLLNAMAGLHQPASGEIRVLGAPPGAMRHQVAYVLQANAVNERLPATVAEVVTMGCYAVSGAFGRLDAADREEIDRSLDRMQIGNLRSRHLGELSGGQRQRVFIAQGLVQRADVLLLDEPVTGLDLVSSRLILDAIEHERSKGRTVLMTTHDLGEAGNASRVLLLAGRVVAAGRPDEVLTRAHLREAYGGRLVDLGEGLSIVDDPHHHAEGDDHTGHKHEA